MITKQKIGVLSCILICSCTTVSSSETSVIYDDVLASVLKESEAIFKQNRSDIEFDDGTVVNSCESYMSQLKENRLSESVNNQLIKSEYLICETINLLQKSNSQHLTNHHSNHGKALWEQLNLSTFPNLLNRAARGDAKTFKEIAPDQSSYDNNQLIYRSENWYISLRIVAEINLDSNRKTDWIIELIEEAKLTNYRNYATLIVYNPQEQDLLKGIIFTGAESTNPAK